MIQPDGVLIACETCGGDGVLEFGQDGSPWNPLRQEACPACQGDGVELVEAEPITMDDLLVMAP